MKKVIIIGGGFAGLHIFYKLRDILNKKIKITLIDKRKNSLLKPSLPEVAFEGALVNHSLVDLEHTITTKGGIFINDEVIKIEPKENSLFLKNGEKLAYDYLFLTLGALKGYNKIKGYKEFGYSICDDKEAFKLWRKVREFDGGKIVTGAAVSKFGNMVNAPKLLAPCEGPIGEVMFMLDYFLKNQKRLDSSRYSIDVFTPSKTFFEDVGNKPRDAISKIMEEKSINLHKQKALKEIKKDRVIFEDGSSLKSDLTIIIPPYLAPEVIKNSALGDEEGFVPTNEQMQHLNYNNIYCAGDLNALAQPKLGHIAIIQASIAAAALKKELGFNITIPEYKPEIFCIMNMGGYDATLIVSDKLYGGSRDIVFHSFIAKMMKWSFDSYLYYNRGHMPPDLLMEATDKLISILKSE